MRSPALLALALAVGCATAAPVPAGAPRPAQPAGERPPPAGPARLTTGEAAELAEVLNRHRARVGCPPLRWHEVAARVAQAHSEDMLRRGYFDHVSPEGATQRDRLRAAGIELRGPTAENIVDAPFGGERLLARWLASPVHRENIEDCGFTHHGIARAGDLWTHLFLTPRP